MNGSEPSQGQYRDTDNGVYDTAPAINIRFAANQMKLVFEVN